jgi:hypothetical protein
MNVDEQSIVSSLTEDYTGTLLDEFTLGKEKFFPNRVSKYSCHTSTIPFCTTIDMDFLRKRKIDNPEEKFSREFHGESYRHVGDCECNPGYCQYVNSNKVPYTNYIARGCPCTNVCTEIGKELSPICYLSFLKTLSHNLKPSKKTLDASEIMFCHDSKSILDNKYPTIVKNLTLTSGFGHLKPRSVIRVLEMTYWFRVFGPKYQLQKLMKEWIVRSKFSVLLQSLKQTLHSINGLLVKKFMALGPEIISYKRLNEQIARLFRDFMTDYMCPTRSELPAYMGCSIFEEARTFFNYVKEFHDDKAIEKRLSWLSYSFENRSLGSFFGTELSRLKGFIDLQTNNGQGDYTKSLAWAYRAVEICQTRNLGYLPYYIAGEQAEEFRLTISRNVEMITREEFNLLRSLVHRELHDAKMEPGQLLPERNPDFESFIKDSIKLELKYTASVRSTVSSGGKVEDSRYFLQMIRENEWRIPIRDLRTFEIIERTPKLELLVEDNDYGFDISSIIFWFSLQMILNFCIERKLWGDKTHYFPFIKRNRRGSSLDDYVFIREIMDARILLINEPGKGRKLVKSHPILNWFLTPGSKMCQKFLAQHPDHKAGLELGAHDWVHSKRISGTSEEASFIYNELTGQLRPGIVSGYTDWTEATDKMSRRRGVAHLLGLFDFMAFPQCYGKLIIIMIREPQVVKEVIQRTTLEEFSEENYFVWQGQIKEGFMMGNQITKTLLHLCHVSERALANLYLKDKGIDVLRDTKFLTRKHQRLRSVPYEFEDPLGKIKVFPLAKTKLRRRF